MPQEPNVASNRQFIETCLELELLHETDAKSLHQAIDQGTMVAQTAVQRGLLTPADVDIVQSLQRPDQIVPGYRILGLIGRGGMGVVYRAEQLDLEKVVALKAILISNVSDPSIAARFEREAKSLARLQHPNIVQALNFGQHEGRYFFAMEYVPGRTCEQAVRDRGVLPAQEVWSIVRQVASGLLHAQRQNLIHRDIKPANLILVPPPEGAATAAEIVKIADFGLAMFADQSLEQLKLTAGDKIIGSPAYMSLEQFGGRPVDFRSDMYALGATAWHLLFGAPLFQGTSVAALFEQKSRPLAIDRSALTVAIPENQLRLLCGLLDPDPQRRPQSYEQLIHAVDALGVCDASLLLPYSSVDSGEMSVDSGDLVETIELAQSDITSQSRWIRWVSAVVVVAGLALAWLYITTASPERGLRTHTKVVGTTPLFDGVTLLGWDVGGSMVGAWNTVEAPDSSTAIACTTRQGALTRRYPDRSNPRISLFVWLPRKDGAVDIDFAFNPTDPSDRRGCLRLSANSTELGEKTGDFGDLEVYRSAAALPTIHDRYHVVHLEQQPSDWFVFLEEELVGTLPIASVGTDNAIRLVVHAPADAAASQSPAFFADIQLFDLQPTPDQAP